MKAKNIATLVEDLTPFCPTRFKEYTVYICESILTMDYGYYNIFNVIESSRHMLAFS